MQEHSDGSTASYYELPEWACELADLIRYKGMNGAQAEMFRALYRGDSAEHSDEQRQAKKLLCYAIDEVVRTHFPNHSFKPYRDAAFSAVLGPRSVAPDQGLDWIPWAGELDTLDNVDADQLVEVRLWDGATEQGLVGYFDWEHTGPRNSDIVAYRILDGEADNG